MRVTDRESMFIHGRTSVIELFLGASPEHHGPVGRFPWGVGDVPLNDPAGEAMDEDLRKNFGAPGGALRRESKGKKE